MNILRKLPLLPLSALGFYLFVFILWKLGVLPSPVEIIAFLESLYNNFGLAGLLLASLLEGIVYVGLYFPGSFVIILAVIASDGSFLSLLQISLIVALAQWVASVINYFAGRLAALAGKTWTVSVEKTKSLSKGLLTACLHPNSLAFYFFNSGIYRRNIWQLLLVPIIMVPYGLLLAVIFYLLREPLKNAIETPAIMIIALLLWLLVAWLLKIRVSRKEH